MPRSAWKGVYVHPSIKKKVDRHAAAIAQGEVSSDKPLMFKTYSRGTVITPNLLGAVIEVHKGNGFVKVSVTPDKLGSKLGEFAPTRKFVAHSGAKRSSKVRQ